MRRREFIASLAGTAALPLAAHAQQGERMRRVVVFLPVAAGDPEAMSNVTALLQGLQEAGWSEGRNVRIEFRWGAGRSEDYRKMSAELMATAPDLVVANGTLVVRALQSVSRTVPIVFVNVADPVGVGVIESLARPGGNATGFAAPEFVTAGKYLELLKEIAPSLARVAVTRDPHNIAGAANFAAIQTVASPLKIEVRPFDLRHAGDLERALTTFAGQPHGGLIVTASALAFQHRELIIKLAARHRLPAIYPYRVFVADGGLICYGIERNEQFRSAASYVNRILKGERPADLPVQVPTKYETIINLKTARALGLTVPPSLLARVDEVIE